MYVALSRVTIRPVAKSSFQDVKITSAENGSTGISTSDRDGTEIFRVVWKSPCSTSQTNREDDFSRLIKDLQTAGDCAPLDEERLWILQAKDEDGAPILAPGLSIDHMRFLDGNAAPFQYYHKILSEIHLLIFVKDLLKRLEPILARAGEDSTDKFCNCVERPGLHNSLPGGVLLRDRTVTSLLP